LKRKPYLIGAAEKIRHRLIQNPTKSRNEIACLLTSVNQYISVFRCMACGVELLQQQAESIGLPLEIMQIQRCPRWKSMKCNARNIDQTKKNKVSRILFLDIFLEDLRKYREEDKLAENGFSSGKYQLTNSFKDYQFRFKTIVVCVNERFLDQSFVGRVIDQDFINDLPENVDVCGENGEFHTFTFDGIFKIAFEIGEVVYRKYENRRKRRLR
jgi:diphthamide synthase (EF-2-diphthine--ammonia ligase)